MVKYRLQECGKTNSLGWRRATRSEPCANHPRSPRHPISRGRPGLKRFPQFPISRAAHLAAKRSPRRSPCVLPRFRPQEQDEIASGLLGAQALAKRHLISRSWVRVGSHEVDPARTTFTRSGPLREPPTHKGPPLSERPFGEGEWSTYLLTTTRWV